MSVLKRLTTINQPLDQTNNLTVLFFFLLGQSFSEQSLALSK